MNYYEFIEKAPNGCFIQYFVLDFNYGLSATIVPIRPIEHLMPLYYKYFRKYIYPVSSTPRKKSGYLIW